METVGQTNHSCVTTGSPPLSDHKIMLIRPQKALPLARNNSKLLILNNIFKKYGIQASVTDLYQEKEDNPYIFSCFTFSRPSYLILCRGSKLGLLHRVKERKTPSLSAQASFAPFSLKVAWSGKSHIVNHIFIPNAEACNKITSMAKTRATRRKVMSGNTATR